MTVFEISLESESNKDSTYQNKIVDYSSQGYEISEKNDA